MSRKNIVNKIKRIKIVTFFYRIFNLSYGTCSICGLPWNKCKSKSVPTGLGSATFATCQYCWDNSNLHDLQFHYTNLYVEQTKQMIRSGYTIDHTLKYLLDSVKAEYEKDNLKKRNQKILLINKRIKKQRKFNGSLFR